MVKKPLSEIVIETNNKHLDFVVHVTEWKNFAEACRFSWAAYRRYGDMQTYMAGGHAETQEKAEASGRECVALYRQYAKGNE